MSQTELTKTLKRAKGDGAAITTAVREYLENSEQELRQSQLSGASGVEVMTTYTSVIDALIVALFEASTSDLGKTGDTALVAMGGYGRFELNIRSDIDLMLLYRKSMTPGVKALTQKMLYVLWDAGLDVGFAVRSVSECLKLGREDLKTLTSLLDIRLIVGESSLFEDLSVKVQKKLFSGKARKSFIDEKLKENSARREKYGGSVYILEPNVKEGEGGLRDYHMATWVVRAMNSGRFDPVGTGFCSKDEETELDASLDFLHRVRNELHFQSTRKNDQLTFDHQETISKIFGFTDLGHELAVERFMHTYYRHASKIDTLSNLIISRCLHKSRAPSKAFAKKEQLNEDFYIAGDVLFVKGPDVFNKRPQSMLRAFEYSGRHGLSLDQGTKDLLLGSLDAIDDNFRCSTEVSNSFIEILKGPNVFKTLSLMHDIGLLERYIPEFSAVTCKVQHDLYHVYTVDRHSLFAVREIELLSGPHRESYPLIAEILDSMSEDDRVLLLLGVLFHDIGKALGKGHAEKGAGLIPDICSRLGLIEKDAGLVEFLVRNHLILPDTAQHRDIHDEKLIIEFAKSVASTRRLDLLYLLTFADVRAVGPQVWNEWKATLFQELYLEVQRVIERGSFEPEDAALRVKDSITEVKRLLSGQIKEVEVDAYFGLLPPRYFLSNSPETVAEHILAVSDFSDGAHRMKATQVKERGYTELTICTHDVHALFSMITGVLTANSVNILGAQINTMTNGITLDILQVTDAYGKLISSPSRIKRMEDDLTDVLTGRVRVGDIVGKRRPSILDKKKIPHVPPRILIDNDISETFTVIEIHASDMIGLLYRISSALSSAGLYIHIAKITTRGDEATDIFYVRDIFGQKIYYKERLKEISRLLQEVIEVQDDAIKA